MSAEIKSLIDRVKQNGAPTPARRISTDNSKTRPTRKIPKPRVPLAEAIYVPDKIKNNIVKRFIKSEKLGKEHQLLGLEERIVEYDINDPEIRVYDNVMKDYLVKTNRTDIQDYALVDRGLLARSLLYSAGKLENVSQEERLKIIENTTIMANLFEQPPGYLSLLNGRRRKGDTSLIRSRITQNMQRFDKYQTALLSLEQVYTRGVKYSASGKNPIVDHSYSLFGAVCDHLVRLNIVCPPNVTTEDQRDMMAKLKRKKIQASINQIRKSQGNQLFWKYSVPQYRIYPDALKSLAFLIGGNVPTNYVLYLNKNKVN